MKSLKPLIEHWMNIFVLYEHKCEKVYLVKNLDKQNDAKVGIKNGNEN